MTKRETIAKWFRAWLDCDGTCITDVFSEDVRYSECYGPVYVGRAQVEKWFADWNVNNRVTRWDIFDFVEQDFAVVRGNGQPIVLQLGCRVALRMRMRRGVGRLRRHDVGKV